METPSSGRNHFIGGPLGFYVTDLAWGSELPYSYHKFREPLKSADYSPYEVGSRSAIHAIRHKYRTLFEAESGLRLNVAAVVQYAAISRYLGAMEALADSKSNSVDKNREDSLTCFFALQFQYAAIRFFDEQSLIFKPIDPAKFELGFVEDPEHDTWMKLLEMQRAVLASFLSERDVPVEQFLKYRHFYDQLPEHFGFEDAQESALDKTLRERFGGKRGFEAGND